MKKALITGLTGQDGSYLAEFLLGKGYEVYGLVRRSSNDPFVRLPDAVKENVKIVYGNLRDTGALERAIQECKPHEVYNLAAQSDVGISFKNPEETIEVDYYGVGRLVNAILKIKPDTRVYQASTSEMFGKTNPPQNEDSPFLPVSPYGEAKLKAHEDFVKGYREKYGLFICSGFLFNHETVASFMPMFCKETNSTEFDVKPIREIVSFDESVKQYQSKPVSGLQVWSKHGWTNVSFASAYPHDIAGDNKAPRFVNARAGAFMATGNHVAFMKGGDEKETGTIHVGDQLDIIELPDPVQSEDCLPMHEEEAELLGMMVGDGSFSRESRGAGIHGKFTNSSPKMREHFDDLWRKVTGGRTVYYPSRSGFKRGNIVGQLLLVGGNDWLRSIDIYNTDRTKRVPKHILNAPVPIMTAFLRGYNACDGLKANPCVYEFRNFKTNSATLAMGLWYLIDKTTAQDVNLTIETKIDGRIFYSLNMLTTTDNALKERRVMEFIQSGMGQRETARMTGISRTFIQKIQRGGTASLEHHLKKNPAEVKKIIDLPTYDSWFYDLETACGEFHCGIGKARVHNSPRRGEHFVTRKITISLAKIKLGLQESFELGNLDAARDWGFAGDYVEAMWLMLQQDTPQDFVIATGLAHTVREFVVASAETLGMKITFSGNGNEEVGKDEKGNVILRVNLKFYRPKEVDALCGDSSKAEKLLGWKPKTSFEELVALMARADYEKFSKGI